MGGLIEELRKLVIGPASALGKSVVSVTPKATALKPHSRTESASKYGPSAQQAVSVPPVQMGLG